MTPFHNRNKLTDKGWQQMSRRLDQELPLQKRRRRLLLWLSLLVLSSVMFVGLVKFFQEKTIKIQIEDRCPKQVVSPQNPQNQAFNAQENNTEANSKIKKGTTQQATANLVTRPAQPHSPSTTYRQRHEEHSAPNSAHALANVWLGFNTAVRGLSAESAAPIAAAGKPSPTLHNAFLDLKYGTVQSASQSENAYLPKDYRVSAVEHAAAPQTETSWPTPAENTLLKPQKNEVFSLGFSLIAGSERFNGLNSAQAGLAFNWQLFRRWGIRSGILYEQFIPSPLDRPVAELDPIEYAIATRNYDFLKVNGGNGLPDVAVPVLKLHRLRAPLLVSFAANKHWQFFSGVSLGYTLYAQAAKRGLVNTNNLVTFRASAENEVSELVTNELPRFNTQGHLGLSYRLRRIELGLFYQQQMGLIEVKSNTLFDADGRYNPRRRALENSKPNRLMTVSSTWFF